MPVHPPPKPVSRVDAQDLRDYSVHPSRVNSIKTWLMDQLCDKDDPVALVSISITASGRIKTKGIGLDPLHARLMLKELESLRARIEAELVSLEAANDGACAPGLYRVAPV